MKCVREIEASNSVFASGARNGLIHIWDIRKSDKKSALLLNTNIQGKSKIKKLK